MLCSALIALCGCGDKQITQALESDANGYLCLACNTKFYTDRKVFPDFCPQCKNPRVTEVLGFVCGTDHHTTLGPRGRNSISCQKCGAATTGLSIPGAKELQAWGAARKEKKEVTGG